MALSYIVQGYSTRASGYNNNTPARESRHAFSLSNVPCFACVSDSARRSAAPMEEAVLLEPIGTHLLHQEVRQRVKDYIVENGLGPGDRLPTETEIAEQLSVSRNVVREALKGLEALGLVEVRKGSGTHVARFDAARYLEHYTYSLIVDGIGMDEMWEVRRALELAFIGKAAARIGDGDLNELDELVTAMEQAPAQGNSALILGLRIHQVIYRCLNNHVLAGLMDAIAEFYARVWSPIREPLTPAELARDVDIHRRLVDALRRHDAEAAQAVLAGELRASPSTFFQAHPEKSSVKLS